MRSLVAAACFVTLGVACGRTGLDVGTAPAASGPDDAGPTLPPPVAHRSHLVFGVDDHMGNAALYASAWHDGMLDAPALLSRTATGWLDCSSDGGWVAFTVDQEPPGANGVYVVPLDGNGTATPTRVGSGGWNWAWAPPAWAPDAHRLAFVEGADRGGLHSVSDLFVLPSTGVAAVHLATTPPNSWPYWWSPGGDAIVHTTGEGLIVSHLDALGTEVSHDLVVGGTADGRIAFSRDGRWMAVQGVGNALALQATEHGSPLPLSANAYSTLDWAPSATILLWSEAAGDRLSDLRGSSPSAPPVVLPATACTWAHAAVVPRLACVTSAGGVVVVDVPPSPAPFRVSAVQGIVGALAAYASSDGRSLLAVVDAGGGHESVAVATEDAGGSWTSRSVAGIVSPAPTATTVCSISPCAFASAGAAAACSVFCDDDDASYGPAYAIDATTADWIEVDLADSGNPLPEFAPEGGAIGYARTGSIVLRKLDSGGAWSGESVVAPAWGGAVMKWCP